MIGVSNNISADQAARHASIAYEGLNSSISSLSSGLRIISAGDDAAGLAVRELLRSDIATARQGSNNVNDALSMLQTVDGATAAACNILARMNELATQASTSTYSDSQKNIMQQEFGQLAEEIKRISQTTSFNGTNLFTSGQTIDISLGDGDTISIDTEDISLGSADLTTDPAAAQAMVSSAISQVSSYRGDLGSKMNRLESAATVIDTKAENLLAAESRVSDVDLAREVSSMASTQVLVQAATAAQAHSNTVVKLVGMLLG
ncbi:MAG: flagellin [Planctomycetota bacterium]|jgi:flagellin